MKLSYISSVLAVSTTQLINNNMKTYIITQRLTAAFSLVEVTLALGVAGFCLIAVLGLLPAGLNTNQNSTRQTTANGILSAILSDIRATPRTATQSPLFGILMSPTSSTPQTLCCDANGACSILSGSQCPNATLFLVTITGGSGSSTPWGRGGGDDGEEDDSHGTKSVGTERFDVKITWPYSKASPAPAAAGNVEAFIGIDRNAKSHGGGEGEDGD